MFRLDGRVAIVTGAGGLLGKRHCQALADAGATVVEVDIPGVDVTSKESLSALRDMVLSEHGRIDILVNNAAVNDMVENPVAAAEDSKFENYPLDLWRRVMDVNVTGTFLCCQVLGAEMAKRGNGSIINIASTYGVSAPDQSIYRLPDGTQPFYKSAAYPTSKGAVVMLTKFLATYWGSIGVRVNALSPGGVENNQPQHFIDNYAKRTPLNRMAAPTDYMGALVFLASDASAYMTGHNLLVDGGWTAW
jgi:NAD(P)-dependent dehydrogenase (short-subunit alcohol dehydrogenase family)